MAGLGTYFGELDMYGKQGKDDALGIWERVRGVSGLADRGVVGESVAVPCPC